MNPMLKLAYDYGCNRALQECGLTKIARRDPDPEDISPEALAAIGAVPFIGAPASAVAAGYYAPRGRIMSRVGHNLAGGMLGSGLGSVAGGMGGAGLGALLAAVQDEDTEEYSGKGALIGAILGGIGGGAYGRHAGQERSQGWDARAER